MGRGESSEVMHKVGGMDNGGGSRGKHRAGRMEGDIRGE